MFIIKYFLPLTVIFFMTINTPNAVEPEKTVHAIP
jgi:hypothetical protein